MKRPDKIYGRTPTAEEFNALIDYIQSLELVVGAGLEMRKTGAGTVVSAQAVGGISLDVVTNVEYNTTTGVLSKSVTPIRVLSKETGTNTTITTAVECPA